MSKPKPEFKANGYLEKTYLDKEGAKHATFEFSVKDSLKLAQLELMGRDLINHCPVLLEVKIKAVLKGNLINARPLKTKIIR
ncbi:MAG: hypothetical protein WCX91_03950 [Candidatus Omnitrophota bacterium]